MKIAAFDSGIGGLSAVAPLFHAHQNLELTYLGDLANLPYGTKSPERIRELTQKNLQWLLLEKLRGADMHHLVIACNTASSHALQAAQQVAQAAGIGMTNVLEPGCRLAVELQATRIVVLATASTIASGSYERKLRELGYAGDVLSKACPLFVPLVEDDLTAGSAVEAIIHRYLHPLQLRTGDAVILGCTHYPFLLESLRSLYPQVRWVEAGQALLREPELSRTFAGAQDSGSSLKLIFTDSTASMASVRRLLTSLGLAQLPVTLECVRAIV
ncbi:MAG: glutamate racemase [Bdellovibrionales bacterium]|nr:glutamate racemase [Bdellovibrionales bacterium]